MNGPTAPSTRLNRDRYIDQVLGCWTGKNIGGTLGAPFEGKPYELDVKGYTTPAGDPVPNDDLDLQLVWLRALQERGPANVDAQVLAEYWLTYVTPHWNEYGIAKANLRRGLCPPMSGAYRNPHWQHSNGAWIRSELWACLAPGLPDVAARRAYADASVDHGAGEGTWGAVFMAALQATAFVADSLDACLDAGLARIPPSSLVTAAVESARLSYAEGADRREARRRLSACTQPLGYFQAPANIGYVVVGLLYGAGDFGESLLSAVNCGDDTDCTGATTGSTLGILHGRSRIPEEWWLHIGDRILTVAVERGNFRPPATLDELTRHVVELAPAMVATAGARLDWHDGPEHEVAADLLLGDKDAWPRLWDGPVASTTVDVVHTRLELEYLQLPVLAPGESVQLLLRAVNQVTEHQDLEVDWLLPEGWTVAPGRHTRLSVQSLNTSPDAVTAVLGSPPEVWPPRSELVYTVTAGDFDHGAARGVLRVVAAGRPTVGLVPITFIEAAAAPADTT